MTTKTYRGRTIAELLPQIKAELGQDAVILSQREGLSGGVGGFFQRPCVELDVTADPGALARIDVRDADESAMPAAEAPPMPHLPTGQDERLARFVEQAQAAAPATPAFAPTVMPQVPELSTAQWPREADAFVPSVFESMGSDVGRANAPAAAGARGQSPVRAAIVPLTPATSAAWPAEAHDALDELAEAGLGLELGSEIVTHAVTDLAPFAGDVGTAPALAPLVLEALAQRIPVTALHAAPGRVIAFVGPGGAGKTRCVAAIATAYATRSDLPVACVTLRAKDDGAELQRALGPAGVPVHGARDGAHAREQVQALRSHSLVLLDTPAVSPRAEAEMRVLARELDELRLDEVHLTLPATTGAVAAREIVDGTAPLRVTALALTHVDETAALGAPIALAMETELPLSFVSRGTNPTGGLRPAVARELALAVVG